MKQKTIEEKRAAVLAYCERVMPNRDFPAVMDWGHIMFGYITFEEKDYEAYFLYISASINPIALYALSSDQTWIAAYRLLGLETADAVEELNDMMQRRESVYREFEATHTKSLKDTCKELDAERAKNAALVAALERIKQVNKEPEMDVFRAGTKMMLIAENALEANKKGGVQG